MSSEKEGPKPLLSLATHRTTVAFLFERNTEEMRDHLLQRALTYPTIKPESGSEATPDQNKGPS